MKKIILALFSIFLFLNDGQAQNCTNPVNHMIFQNEFNQIAIQQTNQNKLNMAIQFVNSNCLLSEQVKKIAQLFTDDAFRLDFCEAAYAHTADPANYYDVYDAFTAFSFAFRLNDFIHAQGNVIVQTNTSTNTPPVATTPVFPNVAYPSSMNYAGKKGCAGPVLNDASFMQAAQNVFIQPTDESKQLAIQNACDNNCLDFSQMMKLVSMLTSENVRLQVMEYAFSKVYDQEHYQSGIVLFTNTQLQNNWTSYAQLYLTPPPVVCSVAASDFNSVMDNIKSKPFPDDKMNVVTLAANDRCFNVEQIRTISKEFPFGDDKMKVFKMLYAKCPDQNNYYKLVDELTFPSEKTDLTNFIKNGGK